MVPGPRARRLENQFRFAYGVLARGKEPIGIVPSFEMKVPIDLIAPPLVVGQFGRRGD